MDYLVEQSLIPKEEIPKYEALPDNQKLLYLYKILKNHPNKNNLSNALKVYAGNISEYGFDDRQNPFLAFIENTKHNFNEEQSSLIRELIENGSLSPNSKWLYKPSLWEEGDEETLLKIKALTYAGNKRLQSNADKKITPESLMDKRGRIYLASTIERLLNSIKVSKESSYTIKNVLERYLKDSSYNKNTIQYLKDSINESNLSEENKEDYLNILKNQDKFKTFLDIPVKQPTKNGLIDALEKTNLNDFYREKTSTKKEIPTGLEVLQNHLKNGEISWKEFISYLKATFEDNFKINKFLREQDNIKKIRDDLVKALQSKIEVVFDESPIEVLNSKLEDAIQKHIDKQKEDISYEDLSKGQAEAFDTLVSLGVNKNKAYSLVKDQDGNAEEILAKAIRGV